jgi:hypothetical protein
MGNILHSWDVRCGLIPFLIVSCPPLILSTLHLHTWLPADSGYWQLTQLPTTTTTWSIFIHDSHLLLSTTVHHWLTQSSHWK